jgi:quercetin dioxygenase-like cupin family protein
MFGKKSEDGYTEILKGIKIKTLNYGKSALMTEFLLMKDSILIEHAHVNEQTGYLVEGKIKLFINGNARIINPGDSWNIPSNIRHKAEIIEDSVAIEVFVPNREDYLKFVNQDDILE